MFCYRFSQIGKSKPSQEPARGSVFSRIRGNNQAGAPRRNQNMQNRLNRPANGGIQKNRRNGPTPMRGVERTGPRLNQRGNFAANRSANNNNSARSRMNVGQRNGRGNANRNRGNTGGRRGSKSKKPLSAQELDKSLDDYMMKDPKTAQSRLDAELSSYMEEAGEDDLMEL